MYTLCNGRKSGGEGVLCTKYTCWKIYKKNRIKRRLCLCCIFQFRHLFLGHLTNFSLDPPTGKSVCVSSFRGLSSTTQLLNTDRSGEWLDNMDLNFIYCSRNGILKVGWGNFDVFRSSWFINIVNKYRYRTGLFKTDNLITGSRFSCCKFSYCLVFFLSAVPSFLYPWNRASGLDICKVKKSWTNRKMPL